MFRVAVVVFGDVTPQLLLNQLSINQGQSIVLTSQNFYATDNSPVSFIVSNITHGHFELVSQPGQPITNFNQSAIVAQQIRFIHDGNLFPPNYVVQIPNPGIALSPPPQNGTVTFYRKPMFTMNSLAVHQGENIWMTTSLLNVTDDYPADQVNFTVSNLQHGQFRLVSSNTSVMKFTEQQLLSGQILFVQDNSASAPIYQVSLNDPYFTLPPTSSASITFYSRPVFIANQFMVQRNGITLITAAEGLEEKSEGEVAHSSFCAFFSCCRSPRAKNSRIIELEELKEEKDEKTTRKSGDLGIKELSLEEPESSDLLSASASLAPRSQASSGLFKESLEVPVPDQARLTPVRLSSSFYADEN
ncbi:MAG: hypothetical protein JSR33_12460 [Proteobacteria bacterium]|nr:hypothetical protein [Pseudomonadota bacterium]